MNISDVQNANEIIGELRKLERVVLHIEVEEGEEDPKGDVVYINAVNSNIQIHATFLVEGIEKHIAILEQQLKELGVVL